MKFELVDPPPRPPPTVKLHVSADELRKLRDGLSRLDQTPLVVQLIEQMQRVCNHVEQFEGR